MNFVPSINNNELTIFILSALIAAGIAVFLALNIAKGFSKVIGKVNYKILVGSIIGFVTILVYFLCSWMGLLVLVVSTLIGMMPALLGVKRSHNMGCLLIPVILFFLA